MEKNSVKEQVEQVNELVEKLAVAYSTDSNGVFCLPDYVAFKAGLQAGLAAAQQIEFIKAINGGQE